MNYSARPISGQAAPPRRARPQTAQLANEQSKLFENLRKMAPQAPRKRDKHETAQDEAVLLKEMDLLNHQRWLLERPDASKLAKKSILSAEESLTFIRNGFKRKECVMFVQKPDSAGENVCVCGRTKEDHERSKVDEESRAGLARESEGLDFDEIDIVGLLNDLDGISRPRSRHNIVECGTNAFGNMLFEARGDTYQDVPAKFVRLSQNTRPKLLESLLYQHWKVLCPQTQLAVSVLTAYNPSNRDVQDEEELEAVAAGLLTAVKATKGLVITEGLNRSVLFRIIGEVFRKAHSIKQVGVNTERAFNLLAVCPWGLIRNKSSLVNKSTQGMNNVVYENSRNQSEKSKSRLEMGGHALNPDHSHFLLVDDGSEFGESKWRQEAFQEQLFQIINTKGNSRTCLTIVLGGDLDTLVSIRSRLQKGLHVILCHGSGGITELLARTVEAHKSNPSRSAEDSLSTADKSSLKLWVQSFVSEHAVTGIEACRVEAHITDCVTQGVKHDQLHVWNMNFSHKLPLDKFLLQTLLGPVSHRQKLSQYVQKLLIWDRVDLLLNILEEVDFDQDQAMDALMEECLLEQRVEFIEALIGYGFAMKKFLTVARLRQFYAEIFRRTNHLREQLNHFVTLYDPHNLNLATIHRFFSALILNHTQKLYERDHFGEESLLVHIKGEVWSSAFGTEKQPTGPHARSTDFLTFKDPYFELFLWALVSRRGALLDLLWTKSSQPLLLSVMAATMLDALANFYMPTQNHLPLVELKKRFVTLTNELLDVGFNMDRQKTFSLLEQRYPRIQGGTLMFLAYRGWQTEVIANPQCQSVNRIHWKRGFTSLSIKRSFLCLLCPLLIFTPVVKFNPYLGSDGSSLNFWEKLLVFYRCPMVKYTELFISFLVFVALYSYVGLFAFRWEYTWPEIALYIWIFILFLGEIRELFTLDANSIKGKVKLYVGDIYNHYDMGLLGGTIIMIILKNISATFWFSRILYCINIVFVGVQLFRYYHASWRLGPKLVTITDMFPEISTFLLLLVVFMVMYGVSTQSVVDPYRLHTWDNFKDLLVKIFLLPYWQMYGELSLDMIQVNLEVPPCPAGANGFGQGVFVPDNSTLHCYPADLDDPERYLMVPYLFLGLYMLFSSVLLLNMLIAVFSSLFETVNADALTVWKWEMHRLVFDLDKKPGLPPPFVILEDVVTLFRWLWRKCAGKKKKEVVVDYLLGEVGQTLQLFEKQCLLEYLRLEMKEDSEALSAKIHSLENRARTAVDLLQKTIIEGLTQMEDGDGGDHGLRSLHAPHSAQIRSGQSVSQKYALIEEKLSKIEETLVILAAAKNW